MLRNSVDGRSTLSDAELDRYFLAERSPKVCYGGTWPECLLLGESDGGVDGARNEIMKQLTLNAHAVFTTFGSMPKRRRELNKGGCMAQVRTELCGILDNGDSTLILLEDGAECLTA